MESKTICIVAPSLQGGGIERALCTLSSHFVKRGHRVIYIACRAGKHFYELDPRVVFREPSFIHTASSRFKVLNYYRTIHFIRRQLREFNPDTILSFGDIINPLALIANRGLGYPIYISDRISPKQNLGRFKNFMKRITYKSASGIIAQTEQAAQYKRQVFGDNLNLRIIPNSLRDIENCSGIVKKNQVIGVGRLSFEKGFDRLIDAFSRIKEHDDWSLILVGDGPERDSLMQQAEQLGIAQRTSFMGLRKDVDRLLAESKIFVIPSRCEGFPNALCEAMASPLPCIAFDCVPTENLITNKVDGIVLKDDDQEGLVDAICKLMDDKVLCDSLSRNAINIRQRLDKETIGDEFLRFIL